MRAIHSIWLDGFLSFAPGTPEIELGDLDVVVGPNGSGKTNLIEALELLAAAPGDFAARVEAGGGPDLWRWRGRDDPGCPPAVEVVLAGRDNPAGRPLRYRIRFGSDRARTEILSEVVEEATPRKGMDAVRSFYRFRGGRGLLSARNRRKAEEIGLDELGPGQSVLSRVKDAERYPEVTWVGERLGAIRSFRDWTFGLDAPLRRAQSADLPRDRLVEHARNVAQLLDHLDPESRRRVDQVMGRFMVGYRGLTSEATNGRVRLVLDEIGLEEPVPPVRMSDGTLRFAAMLAALFSKPAPSVLCVDEPELGLHPDAACFFMDAINHYMRGKMQFLIATHSDSVLTTLSTEPETVLVCRRFPNGTRVERLNLKEVAYYAREKQYLLGGMRQVGIVGSNP